MQTANKKDFKSLNMWFYDPGDFWAVGVDNTADPTLVTTSTWAEGVNEQTMLEHII